MLTPLDIYGKTFAKGFRGYETQEVDDFMAALVKDFEELYKENIALKEEQERLKSKVEHYQQLESTMQNTLLIAQSTAEEVKAAAKRDSDLLLRETEGKTAQMLREAEMNVKRMLDDADMKTKVKRQELDNTVTQAEQKLAQIKNDGAACRAKLRSLLETELRVLSEEKVPDAE